MNKQDIRNEILNQIELYDNMIYQNNELLLELKDRIKGYEVMNQRYSEHIKKLSEKLKEVVVL